MLKEGLTKLKKLNSTMDLLEKYKHSRVAVKFNFNERAHLDYLQKVYRCGNDVVEKGYLCGKFCADIISKLNFTPAKILIDHIDVSTLNMSYLMQYEPKRDTTIWVDLTNQSINNDPVAEDFAKNGLTLLWANRTWDNFSYEYMRNWDNNIITTPDDAKYAIEQVYNKVEERIKHSLKVSPRELSLFGYDVILPNPIELTFVDSALVFSTSNKSVVERALNSFGIESIVSSDNVIHEIILNNSKDNISKEKAQAALEIASFAQAVNADFLTLVVDGNAIDRYYANAENSFILASCVERCYYVAQQKAFGSSANYVNVRNEVHIVSSDDANFKQSHLKKIQRSIKGHDELGHTFKNKLHSKDISYL